MTPKSTSWTASHEHNLPAEVASLVGRELQVARLRNLLDHTRLLTLTGPGGVGKTRLALRVATDAQANFPDGVWLVSLASLADSSLVPRAVATALGIRGGGDQPLLATLVTALASRRLLIVLDNCEHLIGAVARLVETLLGACSHLRLVATSRESLRVRGETVWRVPPLDVPSTDFEHKPPAPDSLAEVAAVALFVERVRARRSDFTLTPDNAPVVATICRRLDGLPLAIELAAAQAGTISIAGIALLLGDALSALAGGSRTEPRQETLRAALDWSYALLDEAESTLFRRLAVFAGSFDLAAAEGICAGDGIEPGRILRVLAALVDKSLVEPQVSDADARYHLLEPIRQYGWEHLETEGEADTLHRRHAQFFTTLAETAEPWLMSGRRGSWMERLATEQDNLRSALAWSSRAFQPADRELGLRLAAALTFFWALRGAIAEGLDWLEVTLARAGDVSAATRARALYGAGELGWHAGRADLARRRAEESEVLWREMGDKRRLAYTLQSLPMATDHPRAREAVAESLQLFQEVGDPWGTALAWGAADIFPLIRDGDPTGQGAAVLEEGLEVARSVGDDWLIAQRLNFLGDLARGQSRNEEASQRYEEAVDLLRRQDLMGTVPSLLHNLGYVALRGGNNRRARLLFREALGLFRDQGDQRGIADCLDGLAGVLAVMGHEERAAKFFGAAEALREPIATSIWPANMADYQRGVALLRARLDAETLDIAWRAGRERPGEEVLIEALAPEPAVDLGAQSSLTPREREVSALVARGLTNRQIGAELFITEGTARLHVKHILQKLGFTSRAQISAWAVEHGVDATPAVE